jgi:hypothetical protein
VGGFWGGGRVGVYLAWFVECHRYHSRKLCLVVGLSYMYSSRSYLPNGSRKVPILGPV